MRRIRSSWKKFTVAIIVVTGMVLMSSCNSQICPAYAKSEKTTTKIQV